MAYATRNKILEKRGGFLSLLREKKIYGNSKMKVLELFSGTGSVKKICDKLGWECISVDITDELHPVDYKVNILEWDYKVLPKDFDIVWASPPCNSFSSMLFIHKHIDQAKRIREEGLPLLDKTLEIIDYFNPNYFCIENPQMGKMKNFMSDLIPYIDVCYCRYGYDYKKPTRIWTNIDYDGKWCNHKKKHKYMIGSTRTGAKKPTRGYATTNLMGNMSLAQKYSIPPKLIEELFSKILN